MQFLKNCTRKRCRWIIPSAQARLAALAVLLVPLAGCLPDTKSKDPLANAGTLSLQQAGEYRIEVNRAGKSGLLGFGADREPERTTARPRHTEQRQDSAAGRTATRAEEITTAALGPRSTQATTSTNRASRQAQDKAALKALLPQPALPPAPAVNAKTGLKAFFTALAGLDRRRRNRPVTILHLGDDLIAADRFSGALRDRLVARFGDAGRGMMNPGVFRTEGVKLVRGGSWSHSDSARGAPGRYDLSGLRMTSSEPGAWLRLTTSGKPFDQVGMAFVSGPDQGDAIIAIDGRPAAISLRAAAPSLKRVRIPVKGREVTLRVRGGGAVTLLSWSIARNRPGIRYISLGLPGASVSTPARWNSGWVAQELKTLAPDLIILGYGVNEGFRDSLNPRAYADAAQHLFASLKSWAPGASLLVMGPMDAARMPRFARSAGLANNVCRALSDGERAHYGADLAARSPRLARWHAPPRLALVRETLKRAAARAGAYYWDWSVVMGGPCGIHAWVNARPAQAAADHRHLTAAGAQRSAEAFYLDLMLAYETYRRVAGK